MLILLAIVIVGYVAGKLKYMGGDFDRRLSNIIIDITCPALILSSTMGGKLPDRSMDTPAMAHQEKRRPGNGGICVDVRQRGVYRLPYRWRHLRS